MTLRFTSKPSGILGIRSGCLERGPKRVPTPYYFPIVNIVTGPPPAFRNGGIWKFIKRELFEARKIDGFMAQILHFTDFRVSPRVLGEWLETPVPEQIGTLTGKSPFLFLDSGGYRLLYNTSLNIEAYRMRPEVGDILSLQARFGGDAVAALDYPIPPDLNDLEAKQRIAKSIANDIETARRSREVMSGDAFVYMAVHGRGRAEARQTVIDLMARLRAEKLDDVQVGLAIGSLVPLSSSPTQVIDIVQGVGEGLQACDWIDPSAIPIHAFGVSSKLIPYLAALGVDSFDGTSYVQQAQNLRYIHPGTFQSSPLLKLEHLECQCQYCKQLSSEGLSRVKALLVGKSFGEIEFGSEMTIKSKLYALIALHNLQTSIDEVIKLRGMSSEARLADFLLEQSRDLKARRTLAHLIRYFPESSQALWETGVSKPPRRSATGRPSRAACVPMAEKSEARLPIKRVEPSTHFSKTLSLMPDAFDVTKMDYRPEGREMMLILPCSQQKPYSASVTHRLVERTLRRSGIMPERYHKVTLSGNFGPVPVEFETEQVIQEYDFYLGSSDKQRIELLVARTKEFLSQHGSKYNRIIGYCTTKSYREVLERSLASAPNAIVLPSPLHARKSSEFRKEENLMQLVNAML